jgi:hypothetical protein
MFLYKLTLYLLLILSLCMSVLFYCVLRSSYDYLFWQVIATSEFIQSWFSPMYGSIPTVNRCLVRRPEYKCHLRRSRFTYISNILGIRRNAVIIIVLNVINVRTNTDVANRLRQNVLPAKLPSDPRKFFRLSMDFESLSTSYTPHKKNLPTPNSYKADHSGGGAAESMSGPVYDLGFVPPDAFGGVHHHHQLLSLDPEEFSRCGHCGFGGCDIRITVCGCVAHAVR